MSQHEKIRVLSPLVEMDGDEMTRILWKMIKNQLIDPHVEMQRLYYDLHLSHRDATEDRVTVEAAEAVRVHGVGVKCATITAAEDRVAEYSLHKLWRSPNATIRANLNGTLFRKPILVDNIRPLIGSWKKPVVIGRHAYGDSYNGQELRADKPGRAEMIFTPRDGGEPSRVVIHDFAGPGVLLGMHNTDASITFFARSCFTYAYDQKLDVWFSVKDTVSQTYDAQFRKIFQEVYEQEWQDRFDAAGLSYFYTLIDDAVARIVRSRGGILWALKNYDGDVLADMVASICGSLAMMSSVLVTPEGHFCYEAAHGTVQRHYYRYLKGEQTSTNPLGLIFAWTGALRKRGELDGTPAVCRFADHLEAAARETVEAGVLTQDLVAFAEPDPRNRTVTSEAFLQAIALRLRQKETL